MNSPYPNYFFSGRPDNFYDFLETLKARIKFSIFFLLIVILISVIIWKLQPWYEIKIILVNSPSTPLVAKQEKLTSLISELEKALKEYAEIIEKLREDYERYSKLAEVKEQEVQALIQQLKQTLRQAESASGNEKTAANEK